MKLVLATHNKHKVEEVQKILESFLPEIEIVSYDGPAPRETGITFGENALIKARTAALHTGLAAFADDSGICVDILGGSPGIFSARWAGSGQSQEANRDLLLEQLADIADPHRTASFVCNIALVLPERRPSQGVEHVAVGTWPGRIDTKARGGHGFGYDPIFVPDGFTLTAAELSREEKNTISHRDRACEALLPALKMNLLAG